jgi:putative adhesin
MKKSVGPESLIFRSPTLMSIRFLTWRRAVSARLVAVGTLLTLLSFTAGVSAQQQMSKRYPGGKNVRVELRNISGTIVVESWNKDEIRLSATIESKNAHVVPKQIDECLVVDVMGDNRGRGDIGDINFKLQVPVNSSVDVETRRGNISVSNIRSGLVRAHVSSEGDIELTNISASHVVAQNVIGNIFFDGEFSSGGTYEFKSTKGDITIRIPGNSAFRLVAASPMRQIKLGDFWNNGFKTQDGRKYVGDVGDGRSSVSIINFSGQITFLRR